MTRGPERSRTLSAVVHEVEALASDDVSEVTLLGQTVNSYHDGTSDFADLLRAVGSVSGIRRVRFTSPHPNDFSDRVIEAMADVASVCEHVHLPLQSGSNRVLKRMVRRYTREQFVAMAERLRSAIPGLAITTDLIVGFPGERDEDFEDTVAVVREVEFDDAYTFRYSVREGTAAPRLGDPVPQAVSGERLERLITAVREVAGRKNVHLVGSTHEVLVEAPARRGDLMQCRTRHNKIVLLVQREVTGSRIGYSRTVSPVRDRTSTALITTGLARGPKWSRYS